MAYSGSDSLRSTLADGSDYIFDYCCDLCKKQEDYVEATGYCSDCRDYLCSECFNYHLRPRPMRHHVLLDQHQMPKDQQQNSGGDTCTEACTTHPHKTVEYFCNQHDELGCSVCMTLNHRNCRGVEHIPDIASDILNNEEYIGIQTMLTSFTQDANTAIQVSQDQAKLSQTYHTNALAEFKQIKKDISIAVDRIEKNLIKEADNIKGDDEKKMKSLEVNNKNVFTDVQALDSKFNILQQNGQFCQIFIAMKRARGEIKSIEARMSDPVSGNDVLATNYKLVLSKQLRLLLDTPKTMVHLEVVQQPLPVTYPTTTVSHGRQSQVVQQHLPVTYPTTAVSHSRQSQPAVRKKTPKPVDSPPLRETLSASQQTSADMVPRAADPVTHGAVQHRREVGTTRAQHDMDINARHKADSKTPRITGCVVLPDDNLVVVDYRNKTVKLIQDDVVVSQLKFAWNVMDITKMNSTRVAVTSPATHTILVVNVSTNRLELDRELKVKCECKGIACINDKLVVSYDWPSNVDVINMKGKVQQTVVTEAEGKGVFTWPWQVAVGKDMQNIYISDSKTNIVTRFDLTGQIQVTYKNRKLRGARGLTVDNSGRVYVCGEESNNILQLTADLTEMQVLLQPSDGVVRPMSVCYCETTDRLYIGMFKSDVVKVYQLK